MKQDIPIKQELIEEDEINNPMKTEKDDLDKYLIENVESYLKYCCPECVYSSKDAHDFSIHVSEKHFTANMFFQSNAHYSDNVTNQMYMREKSITSHPENSVKNLVNTEWGKCAVPNCNNLNSFRFLKFPQQQQKLDLWLQLCGLKMVKREDRICANHFKNSDFCLRPSSHPSLNLDGCGINEGMLPTKGKKKNFRMP